MIEVFGHCGIVLGCRVPWPKREVTSFVSAFVTNFDEFRLIHLMIFCHCEHALLVATTIGDGPVQQEPLTLLFR